MQRKKKFNFKNPRYVDKSDNKHLKFTNMKNTALIILFFGLFVTCKNTTQKPGLNIEIRKETFPVTIKVDDARSNLEIPLLSNFSEDVSYIKLKTPPNIFIRDIRDVQIAKNNIFIDEGSKVMVFNKEGTFIKQIGRQGRGPDEYINLRSFCFDINEDLLFYTGNSGDILKFDSMGEIIEKLFRVNYADYLYSFNNILVFSGMNTMTARNMPDGLTQFLTTNISGQRIDSIPLPLYSINDWRKKPTYSSGNHPSTKFKDFILLYGSKEDTIFHVTNTGKIEARYFLNFGQYSMPFENRYLASSGNNISNYIIALSSPFETTNSLWMKCTLHKGAFILRYDKTSKKAFTFYYKGKKEIDFARGRSSVDELGIVNDFDGGPDFFPEWSVYDDSTQLFISAKEAFDLKKELTPEYFKNKEIKFRDKKDKLLELVNNLEEKDDYVLMIVKLK